MDSNIACDRAGSITLRFSWPASTAKQTVTSFPNTLKQIWLTTSGMTGFTFAGMMDDPACISGRLISLSPALGPDESSLKSLQILEIFAARRLMMEWTAM